MFAIRKSGMFILKALDIHGMLLIIKKGLKSLKKLYIWFFCLAVYLVITVNFIWFSCVWQLKVFP